MEWRGRSAVASRTCTDFLAAFPCPLRREINQFCTLRLWRAASFQIWMLRNRKDSHRRNYCYTGTHWNTGTLFIHCTYIVHTRAFLFIHCTYKGNYVHTLYIQCTYKSIYVHKLYIQGPLCLYFVHTQYKLRTHHTGPVRMTSCTTWCSSAPLRSSNCPSGVPWRTRG